MAEKAKQFQEQARLPVGEQPLLMLLDGNAMIHRAWHAIPTPLTIRKTGEEVRGVYGFCQMLLKAIEQCRPTYLAVTFDRPTPTFRHLQFEAYKAQRPETAPELHQQFPYVRRLMEVLHVPIFEMDRFEADDLLGTLSAQAEAMNTDTVILTGDTDTLQLVSPRVRVLLQYRIAEQVLFDVSRVRERYGGLTPAQLIHLKALRGDPSDNIPGVPGVGEKTALQLLQRFGTVQGIYENLDKLPVKQRELLQVHRDRVVQGLELVTIVRDVPVRLNLEASRFGQYDRREVVEFLKELEFFSLVQRIPLSEVAPADEEAPVSGDSRLSMEAVERVYQTIVDEVALQDLVQELKASSGFAFDTETAPMDPKSKQVDPMRDRLVGLSFAVAPGKAWYVPVGHRAGPQVALALVLESLRAVLEDAELPKAAHNANYDMTLLANHGVAVAGLTFDTMVAAHLLGRKTLGLKSLALDALGEEMTPISDLIGTGKNQVTMDQVPLEKASPYACADADMTYRLRSLLEEELRQQGCWG
ncbi:MAG: DNA polymerase I, partial [Chloroflexi bacterium]|nr:DNA polymerase I [Chloroflexota bacterium]